MDNLKQFIKTHRQKIALVIGYLLVAGLAFGLGTFSNKPPQNLAAQTANPLPNYNPNVSSAQTETTAVSTTQPALKCEGKIKGSSSLIYHVPGGSFYNKTTKPIRCFDTETQAKAAGFRKSSR